ncbi:hypothetical protein EVAR_56215_1 [Eumeta japonica]|uniref:Uncharacterized protein n=1 Tax=Eumeta variegata TaxID=151549 RepID=A0A4C1YY67_EUMVA|nr:hypothetical protein EVAR_56215_1 [Eumeta japonica]
MLCLRDCRILAKATLEVLSIRLWHFANRRASIDRRRLYSDGSRNPPATAMPILIGVALGLIRAGAYSRGHVWRWTTAHPEQFDVSEKAYMSEWSLEYPHLTGGPCPTSVYWLNNTTPHMKCVHVKKIYYHQNVLFV